jgi:Tfp pilus assembly protein PilF
MKSLVALMILTFVAPLARADTPDDQYILIYNMIQQGDLQMEKGQTASALAKYKDAQSALKTFQTENPEWYKKVVKYRLNYLAAKIAQLSSKTPMPSTNTAPTGNPAQSVKTSTPSARTNGETVVAPVKPVQAPVNLPVVSSEPAKGISPTTSAADSQIKALQDQIRAVESDKALLQAKLREALSAQPAAVDPRELAKAQAQIKDLQKENELLKISLAEAKTNSNQVNPGAGEQGRKALEDANRKVAQLTAANATMAMEKDALEARFKALGTSPDAGTAALREENEILKKQLASVKSREAAMPDAVDLNRKLQEAQSELAILQSEQEIWRLEKTALQNQLRQRVPTPSALAFSRPPAVDTASAEKIRQLEAQRDELQKSLTTATKLSSGGRKSKQMTARINEMTREMAGLRSRIDILEAHPVPYAAEELALVTKPDATTLVAASVHHSAVAKSNKELTPKMAVLLAEAKQYWVAHDLEKAEQKYLEVVKLDSKETTFLADLASIQSDRGRTADAEKNLKSALAIDPNDDYTLFVLGILKLRQEKFDESLEALSRAAQTNPQNAKIQNYIGIALSEKGVRGPAEAAFRKAIQIDPGYGDAHANLAFVYLTQKPPMTELARWHYRKALDAGHAHDANIEKLLDQTKTAANP